MEGARQWELWAGMGICSPWSWDPHDIRGLSLQEACLDGCAGKLVHSNHRLMGAYVQLMPSIVQRRISDYEAPAAQAVPGSSPTQVPGAAAAALPAAVGTETHPSQRVAASLPTAAESAPDAVS